MRSLIGLFLGIGASVTPFGSALASTVPVPAGTFVTHFGKQVHYDGAKDEECVLLITGAGPATSTRVDQNQK
ncbi:MAG TPA: hypothetical protein VGM96_17700 [Reyranella sp.]|jgi:hypothetical protein